MKCVFLIKEALWKMDNNEESMGNLHALSTSFSIFF